MHILGFQFTGKWLIFSKKISKIYYDFREMVKWKRKENNASAAGHQTLFDTVTILILFNFNFFILNKNIWNSNSNKYKTNYSQKCNFFNYAIHKVNHAIYLVEVCLWFKDLYISQYKLKFKSKSKYITTCITSNSSVGGIEKRQNYSVPERINRL